MKKFILMLMLLLSFESMAAPNDKVIENSIRFCFVQLTEGTQVNAYSIDSIYKKNSDEVIVTHGQNYTKVNAGEGRQDEYITQLIMTMKNSCK